MSRQISLTVSDDIFRRAEVMAGRSGRNVADVLTEAIEVSLDPLALAGGYPAAHRLVGQRILAAADGAMPLADDMLLGELLERQRAIHSNPKSLKLLEP